MMKLRAVIERIADQNGESGYSILKAREKGYDDIVTLVGNMLDVTDSLKKKLYRCQPHCFLPFCWR